jgi:hypothetical protein
MSTPTVNALTPVQCRPEHRPIYTTLYDLIAAISEEVGPEEDHLVTATLIHLLNSGRVKFAEDGRELRVVHS